MATKESPNVLVIWDESVAGQSAADIASAVWAYLEEVSKRNEVEIDLVAWADNCSGQVNSV